MNEMLVCAKKGDSGYSRSTNASFFVRLFKYRIVIFASEKQNIP